MSLAVYIHGVYTETMNTTTQTTIKDTTKLLPGGFYFTNDRDARGRNIYRMADGRLFTMYAGLKNFMEEGDRA